MLIGTVSCPPVGDRSSEAESPEPKGPPQTQSSGPEREVSQRKREVGQDEGESLFLSPAGMVTNGISYKTSCWVCGLGPVGVGNGLPYIGIPLGVNFTIQLSSILSLANSPPKNLDPMTYFAIYNVTVSLVNPRQTIAVTHPSL